MYKHKKLWLVTLSFIMLSFVGCSSDKGSNIQKENLNEANESNESNEISNKNEDDIDIDIKNEDNIIENKKVQLNSFDSNEITVEDMKYYSEVYEFINDFYERFTLIGDAVDARNDELTNEYLEDLKLIEANIKKIKPTEHFKDSHEYLESALNQYINGLNKLKLSYNEIDFEEYMNADTILNSGGDDMNIYAQYVGEALENFSIFLDSISEIEYYFQMIVLYEYDENFKDDENKALFTIERGLCNLSIYTDKLMKSSLNNNSKESSESLNEINNIISKIENITVENSDIIDYRDNTTTLLKQYIEILNEFVDNISNDSFKDNIMVDINAKLEEMKYKVYDNLQSFSAFYNSYGYDLGFTNSDVQLSEFSETVE